MYRLPSYIYEKKQTNTKHRYIDQINLSNVNQITNRTPVTSVNNGKHP